MKINWLVDSKIFKDDLELQGLIDSIDYAKYPINLYLTKHILFDDDYDVIINCLNSKHPTVVYGTINFCKKVQDVAKKHLTKIPYIFGLTSDIDCFNYMSKFPKEWMLNSEYVFVPFVRFVEGENTWFNMFNTQSVFIRPNSGTKLFTGQLISKQTFDYEISSLRQLTGVVDSSMILVAPAQEILSESRFVISNKKVLHGTKYIQNGYNTYDKHFDTFPCEEVKKLAEQVAKFPYQIDIAYVCDIAYTANEEAKIIEFNAFSCAGMYSTVFQDIMDGINESVILNEMGEIFLER